MYMKKYHRKSTQTKFWKHAWAICNFHLCYNFALLLHVNAIVFNQSETCNFSCTLLRQKKVTIYLFDHISDVLFFWLFLSSKGAFYDKKKSSTCEMCRMQWKGCEVIQMCYAHWSSFTYQTIICPAARRDAADLQKMRKEKGNW